MKQWLLSQGWMLIPVVLPMILPNPRLYLWTRIIIGKPLKAITIKVADKPFSKAVAWIINSIPTICSAISDEIRGVPCAEQNKGMKASEYAASPPKMS